uniref:NAC transcription factor 7 n=1 Tax=Rheum palmatum TaxID=137221 RepID=A0AA50AFM0_RHEPA|nr:NAC transcription factor 7 [Rheum palmatum]
MELCPANGRLQPGFRFHPTNEELVMYYLKRKVLGKCLKPEIITEVDVYQFHPKDLQELSFLKKDLNWYFFCPRGKKYGCGERTNRATHSGYWKATGVDRVVLYKERPVGKIKTLVYHEGKPPKGKRTDWVMHEYKLEDKKLADEGVFQGSYVLCKIYEKSGWGPKNSEQYGAPFIEEEWEDDNDILNNAQVVHIDNHNHSNSGMTNSGVSNVLVNACATSTSEQVYSGAVSVVSAVDQAPTPMPNAAANVASSSKDPIPYYDYAADQVLTPVSVAGNLVLCSDGYFPNYNDPMVVRASTPMPKASDIASTLTGPVPLDDDEIDRMLDRFVADDYAEVFGSLGNLDHLTALGRTCAWINTDEGGLNLTDLDAPL